ncbi:hypothetical protein [Tabrizicola aquatica]|uniref:hypothetical protein n=1 Tax=Tabrizicola aquatica TaxID=909926 RepID=UPI000CD2D34F|nr:hypothetical protein [Tabrizicola aquatica]
MRLALACALVLSASPLRAEPPRISLVFGADRLTAQAEDIRSVRRVDEGAQGAALVIRLVAGYDRQMSALTLAHVGETGQLLICGQIVVEPVLDRAIHEAVFVISDTDRARIDRLQALLDGPVCAPIPQG